MRGRKFVLSGFVAMVSIMMAALAVIAADQGATNAPDEITIKAALWSQPTKAPVPFTHKKHAEDYKISCKDCHHVMKDGKNVWESGQPVDPCAKCHTEPTIQGEKKLPPDQQKLNLKLAYHDNCQGCHQKLKKENPQTKAPTTCTGCHPTQK